MAYRNIFPVLFLLLFFTGCGKNRDSGESENGYTSIESIKLKQYFVAGQRLYNQYCSNCHKEDGTGLARLIPPLKDTDFSERDSLLACIIKYGLKGEIVVNGIMYDQPMPANAHLTNLEIAEISTFIHKKFFGEELLVSIEAVNKALSNCEQ